MNLTVIWVNCGSCSQPRNMDSSNEQRRWNEWHCRHYCFWDLDILGNCCNHICSIESAALSDFSFQAPVTNSLTYLLVVAVVVAVRYEVDETSPEDTLEDAMFCPDGQAACYQILSKPIGVRQSQSGSAGVHQGAMASPNCCDHCQHWLLLPASDPVTWWPSYLVTWWPSDAGASELLHWYHHLNVWTVLTLSQFICKFMFVDFWQDHLL